MRPDEIEWDEEKTERIGPIDPASIEWDEGGTIKAEDMGYGKTAALGASQGASLGFADELWGAADAIGPMILPGGADDAMTPEERYRRTRDAMRREWEAAKTVNPKTAFVSELAGGLAVPVPGGAAAQGTKLGTRLLRAGGQGAAMGAVYGAGSSKADLLNGEVGEFALDVGVGALAGAGGGALGEGIGAGLGAAGRGIKARFQSGADDAMSDLVAQKTAAVEKELASKQGQYRSAVQSASRDIEVMAREVDALPPGQLKQDLLDYLNSAEGMALREQVAGNKLVTAPERVQEMAAKLAEFQTAQAGKQQAIQGAVDDALQNFASKQVKPRVSTLGHRFLPAMVGAGAGAILGDAQGAGIGGGIGSLIALGQGRPGVIIRNLIRSPEVRHKFYRMLLSLTGGNQQKAGGMLRPLMSAEAKGDKALATVSYLLSQKHPEFREALRRVANSEEETEEPPVASR